jgi:hypothetical protein
MGLGPLFRLFTALSGAGTLILIRLGHGYAVHRVLMLISLFTILRRWPLATRRKQNKVSARLECRTIWTTEEEKSWKV